MAALEEVVDDYTASLAELRMNKKPLISMLTILAEDYVDHAPSIVEAVEAHLQKVQSDIKLPVLYLIDSIVKTVSKPYLRLFTKNIVDTFCSVFEKVDEATRANMWKLRQTWNEVFPIKKMFALDVRVHSIDPAWPIMSLPAGTLSEKAIKKLKEAAAKQTTSTPPAAGTPVTASISVPTKLPVPKPVLSEEARMHEQLLKKQKELIELQKQKIELELLQAKANLEQQRKQLNKQNSNPATDSIKLNEDSANKPEDICLPDHNSTENKLTTTETPSNSASSLNPRDPRIKTAAAATSEKNIDPPCAELFRQEQLIEQLKQQIEAKLATEIMLNNALKEIASYKPEDVKPLNDNTPDYNSKKDGERPERPQHISTLALMSNSDYTPSKRSRSHKSRRHRKSRSKSSRSSPSNLIDEASSPDHRHFKRKRKNRTPSPVSAEETVPSKSVSCLREEQIISMVDLKFNKQRGSPEKDDEKDAMDDNKDDEPKPKESTTFENKEDLDLRVFTAPSTKRKSESLDLTSVKKKKIEVYDPLFGKEDVDLRTLSNSSPTGPIFSNKGNSWATIKSTPNRNYTPSKLLIDRNSDRDRLGRPRLFKKSGSLDVLKDHGAGSVDSIRNELHIEIMLKQAAEQLNQGTITKSQYNTLIQEVFHMCEDRKLKAAQRKEQELEMMMRSNLSVDRSDDKEIKSVGDAGNDVNVIKNQSLQPRIPGQTEPRWANPWFGPWIPPPPMPPTFPPAVSDGFRSLTPWQNPPLRPDFPPTPFGLCSQVNVTPPVVTPSGAIVVPTRPIGHSLPCNPVGRPGISTMGSMSSSGMIMSNVPGSRSSPNSAATTGIINTGNTLNSSGASSKNETGISFIGYQFSTDILKQLHIPSADPNLIAEIERDTMKSINIDGTPREIRYYGTIGIVFLSWNDPRDIGFQDGSRRVLIDGKHSVLVNFNDDYKEFFYGGESHTIKLGTPTRELYINDQWYECCFGGGPITIDLHGRKVTAQLEGPIPQVKIGNTKRTDLVVGKIKLIINARTIVPIFLDAKPQIFEIEGQKCTLEFTDALQVVLLNGRPFNVEFDGLPKPIVVAGKKHFIGFSGLPQGFYPGYVKIKGMKGEINKDSPIPAYIPIHAGKKLNVAGMSAMPEPPSVPPGLLDHNDSNSEDCMEITYGSTKPVSHLAVLSSVVPSAMAPSSGMSYQAEPMENPPVRTPPLTTSLNLGDLLQKLADVGAVRNQAESKKQDKEKEKKMKEPQVIPVTFDKPDTLKLKQPGIVTSLYNGMQCSSCGTRFLPEMATRYSHHLDWHFRQNRKEKESAKKAHSRLWYHDISDWIQFEEIEDLDDRVQSWFELEKQAENETAEIDSQPSIPAGSNKESCCEVCQETFEQFYNEEKEEWHFRPAVIYENKSYHPQCLADHQRSLERSAKELQKVITEIEIDSQNEDESKENEVASVDPAHEILQIDGDDEVTEIIEDPSKEVGNDEKITETTNSESISKVKNDIKAKTVNKKVIEVKKNAKIPELKKVVQPNKIKQEKNEKNTKTIKLEEEKIKSNLNQNKIEKKSGNEKVTEVNLDKNNVKIVDKNADEDDDDPIEIIEPIIKEIIIEDLIDSSDEDVDEKENTKKESSKEFILKANEKQTVPKVEKKREEKVPDDVPLIFDNVKVKQEPIDLPEEKLAKAGGVDTTQVAVKSSIDGNVELDSSTRTRPAGASRIKINITKSSTTTTQKKGEKKKLVEPPKESSAPARPMIAAAIKPLLQGKKMSILPTVEKGQELSGLCSVM